MLSQRNAEHQGKNNHTDDIVFVQRRTNALRNIVDECSKDILFRFRCFVTGRLHRFQNQLLVRIRFFGCQRCFWSRFFQISTSARPEDVRNKQPDQDCNNCIQEQEPTKAPSNTRWNLGFHQCLNHCHQNQWWCQHRQHSQNRLRWKLEVNNPIRFANVIQNVANHGPYQ